MKLIADRVSKEYVIEARSVSVLEDITFSVNMGERIALLGRSGCGKSTLLKCIGGFESISSGCLSFDDKKILKPGSERGIVFQNYSLYPWLTVWENIIFGLRLQAHCKLYPKGSDPRYELANYYLDAIKLTGYKDFYPHELSGGMKQRVAIARSFVLQPKILLMDEPFGALDAFTRQNMQDLLLRIHGVEKPILIFVTHDINEALSIGQRVFVMKDSPGRIAQDIVVDISGSVTYLERSESQEFSVLRRQIFEELCDESC